MVANMVMRISHRRMRAAGHQGQGMSVYEDRLSFSATGRTIQFLRCRSQLVVDPPDTLPAPRHDFMRCRPEYTILIHGE